MSTALVTGAAQGFGFALTAALTDRRTTTVVDARDGGRLHAAVATLAHPDRVVAVPGDVTDPAHRGALLTAVRAAGGLDLLVHNASELGPSPLPSLAELPLHAFEAVYETNVIAPFALTRLLLPLLRSAAAATVVTISSDAATEAYPGWGGYGSSKAALDQLAAVLGAEEPALRVYAFDPGDMRTAMHQRAFPGEDISDRPEPATVVPALLRLLDERPASGRYRAADLGSPIPREAGR
ncbi:SDR family NAD(P)-dependent oxidoreductase [Pseudonocardia asaccharolytica]|uniref:Short-chain dehydrogenase n=1 Tax=Pseudonocardia asaccharolytica DSM 44247 = NBRC 16224 TaxID=1123024 RepID=A0A511D1G3_9PSEU|nr:SDR family NAD(P)-dependent oxidoreductase [Pseudonocardia asaccharolytica]GEL18639.1 short-chain dehydrogenase [Pseudonocardia asaccharolytica DSM 44247 = NBRC 16224]